MFNCWLIEKKIEGCIEIQANPEQKQSCPWFAPSPELAVAVASLPVLHWSWVLGGGVAESRGFSSVGQFRKKENETPTKQFCDKNYLLVRAECVRQRNEVAIKLGIIFSSSSLSPVIC
jgi:hypothetical protein